MTAEAFDWADPDTGEKHTCAIPDGLPKPPGDGKTVAEILDQMRNGPIPPHKRDREMLVWLADRLDAAVMRERAEAATIAATQAVNMTEERCRRDFGGNVAKMREVLEGLVDYWNRCDVTFPPERRLRDKAIAALAAPPRNCDIYATDEEADRAFEAFCDSRDRFAHPCGTCPHNKNGIRCRVSWLLAPATPEKGGDK